MLSKLITTGTTCIVGTGGTTAQQKQGRLRGFTMSSTAVTLALFDTLGTGSLDVGTNSIDYVLGVTGSPTTKMFPEEGIPFYNGLHSVLGAAGTAVVYYS